jgi:predicted nucleic acid-binding protein
VKSVKIVIDASIAAKWFLEEEHAAEALRLTEPAYDLLAPELLWVEVAAALRRRFRRGQMPLATFNETILDLLNVDVTPMAVTPLVRRATRFAVLLDHGVYDCIYLALAAAEGCQLATADRRLHDKVERSKVAKLTLWIGDVP